MAAGKKKFVKKKHSSFNRPDPSNLTVKEIDKKMKMINKVLAKNSQLLDLFYVQTSNHEERFEIGSTNSFLSHHRIKNTDKIVETGVRSSKSLKLDVMKDSFNNPQKWGRYAKPLPSFKIDLEDIQKLVEFDAGPFLSKHPDSTKMFYLSRNFYEAFLPKEPKKALFSPTTKFSKLKGKALWTVAIMDSKTSQCNVLMYDATTGSLLYSLIATANFAVLPVFFISWKAFKIIVKIVAAIVLIVIALLDPEPLSKIASVVALILDLLWMFDELSSCMTAQNSARLRATIQRLRNLIKQAQQDIKNGNKQTATQKIMQALQEINNADGIIQDDPNVEEALKDKLHELMEKWREMIDQISHLAQ